MRLSSGFRHGVHPPEEKELTARSRSGGCRIPTRSCCRCASTPASRPQLCVKVGDHVERGDPSARPTATSRCRSTPPPPGTVTAIGWWPHPDGSMAMAVRIAVDRYAPQVPRPRLVPAVGGTHHRRGGDARCRTPAWWASAAPPSRPTSSWRRPRRSRSSDPDRQRRGVRAVPHHGPPHHGGVSGARVSFGIRVMMQRLGREAGGHRGREEQARCHRGDRSGTLPTDLDITILPLTVKYPQGAEKMLIKAVLGLEVPSGKLPMHVGVVVQNVGVARGHRRGVRDRPAADRADRDRDRARPASPGEPDRAGGHAAPVICSGLRRPHARRRGDRPRRADDGHGAGGPRRAACIKGTHRRGGAGGARDTAGESLALHPVRALPGRLPGLPEPPWLGAWRGPAATRRWSDPPRRLHALRLLFLRLPVQHPAVAALRGGKAACAAS